MKSTKPECRSTDRRVDTFLAITSGLKALLQVVVLAVSLLKHLLH